MKSILIVYNEIPRETYQGGNIRVFNFIRELSKYFKVTLLTYKNYDKDNSGLKEISNFCEVVLADCSLKDYKGKPLHKKIYYIFEGSWVFLKKLNPFTPKLLRNSLHQNYFLRKKIIKMLKKRKFDFIQVENFYTAPVLFNLQTNSKRIIDFMNVYSHMNSFLDQKNFITKYEKKLRYVCDLAITCSKEDENRLRNIGYGNVITVLNGVDIKYFNLTKKSSKAKKYLLFVGALKNYVNIFGLKYFFKKVYPFLDKNVEIRIVGDFKKEMFSKESKLDNVYFEGYVDDVRDYYANSIFICPVLDSTGGPRLKVLTAMAMGAPVVSTPIGAEGIEYNKNKNILIGNTPREFANNVNILLKNGKMYSDISVNSRRLILKNHSWENIMKGYHGRLISLK